MPHTLWYNAPQTEITAERIQAWLATADANSALFIVGLAQSQLATISSVPGLDGAEVYQAPDGTVATRWASDTARELETRRSKEHRELLLILQDALIEISQRDADLASKLAARAYVHLKTDPTGQRRFDGLLHRFTGVLHRRPQGIENTDPAANGLGRTGNHDQA